MNWVSEMWSNPSHGCEKKKKQKYYSCVQPELIAMIFRHFAQLWILWCGHYETRSKKMHNYEAWTKTENENSTEQEAIHTMTLLSNQLCPVFPHCFACFEHLSYWSPKNIYVWLCLLKVYYYIRFTCFIHGWLVRKKQKDQWLDQYFYD